MSEHKPNVQLEPEQDADEFVDAIRGSGNADLAWEDRNGAQCSLVNAVFARDEWWRARVAEVESERDEARQMNAEFAGNLITAHNAASESALAACREARDALEPLRAIDFDNLAKSVEPGPPRMVFDLVSGRARVAMFALARINALGG